MAELNGANYRVRATHPRRPGPLRITDRSGQLIAQSGDLCTGVAPALLVSMIANGYVERLEGADGKAKGAKAKGAPSPASTPEEVTDGRG